MNKIIISSDSTCDLTPEIIKEYDIKICPISIILGDKEYHDTVDVTADQIIDFVKTTGTLPKTSAIGQAVYEEYFTKLKTDGDKILHFCISSKASSCINQARAAAEAVGGVTVIDSYALSSGQGIQIICAAEMLSKGKSLEETVKFIEENKNKVQVSFVVDTLEFLHKGGRCSSVALVASKVLKIHPSIAICDGALSVKKKYLGSSMQRALTQYVHDTAAEYRNYDDTRVFITHSPSDPELVELVKERVKAEFEFKEIIESEAGSTITSHCGYNTIGIIFYTK